MNTDNHEIIKTVLSNNIIDFKNLLGDSVDSWKEIYPQLLNAMLYNKRVDFLTYFFEKFPNISTILNSNDQNIAHIFAIKGYDWASPVLDVLPSKVFSQKDSNGLIPFYSSCASSGNEIWEKLLSLSDFKPNYSDNNLSVSALYLSVFSDNEYKVNRLLELGEDPNIKMRNGVNILDVALEKRNWNIISSLTKKLDFISPEFILKAVKDFSNSENSIQALLDSDEMQKKIFPISQEDKVPVWSYFFYYVSWEFIKKNESFLRERFFPDLNKNSELESVIYSCFLGKRDALKKVDWLINSSNKFSWKSIDDKYVKNESTFGKQLPKGYAFYLNKLYDNELYSIVKNTPKWMENISYEDNQVINLILLGRGIPLITYKKSNVKNYDLDNHLRAFEDGKENKNASQTQFIVNYLIKKVPKNILRENYSMLNAVCNKFKIINTVLYTPFVDDLKNSSSPLNTFKEICNGKSEHIFMEVIIQDLLSVPSNEKNNKILEDLSINKHYQNSVLTYLSKVKNSSSNIRSKSKLLNFDFPFQGDLVWSNFTIDGIYPPLLLNVIGACHYSDESLKLFDKINLNSVASFSEGNNELKHVRFQYSNLITNLNLSMSVNVKFLEKLELLGSEELTATVATYLLSKKADCPNVVFEKARNFINSLEAKKVSEIVSDLTTISEAKEVDIVHILKIAKDKEIDLCSVYWDKIVDFNPEFYVKTITELNDFSYFYKYIPQGKEIDPFEWMGKFKTPGLLNFLNSQEGVSKMKSELSGFTPKDALFLAINVFSLQENKMVEENLDLLKNLINKSLKNATAQQLTFQEQPLKTFVESLEKIVDSAVVVDFFDNTELNVFADKFWNIEMRAKHSKIALEKHLGSMDETINPNQDDLSASYFKM